MRIRRASADILDAVVGQIAIIVPTPPREELLCWLTSHCTYFRDGDALPPNPAHTRTGAFLRPPDHPHEWGCHKAFTEAADSIAITYSNSPFVLPVSVSRLFQRYCELFMNDRVNAAGADRRLAEAINRELADNLRDRPVLRARYEKRRFFATSSG